MSTLFSKEKYCQDYYRHYPQVYGQREQGRGLDQNDSQATAPSSSSASPSAPL